MKLSKLPNTLIKAQLCTTRAEAQEILAKTKKLTRKIVIITE